MIRQPETDRRRRSRVWSLPAARVTAATADRDRRQTARPHRQQAGPRYALEQLVAAGITEIGIIVGDTADQVRASVGDGGQLGASVTYIPQAAPLGLAHAVVTARDWLG